jgi:SNF2 family DNA or RNA helicase
MFQMGMVQKESWTQNGSLAQVNVHSESSTAIYQVTLNLLDNPSNPIESSCTCPVHTQCKHAAAAVMHYHALNRPKTGASDAEITQWLQRFNPMEPATSSRSLVYVLENHVRSHSVQFEIKLMKCRRRQNGEWGVTQGNIYPSEALLRDDYLDVTDRQICAELIRRSTGFRHLSEPMAASLLEQMVKTNRCYWHTMDSKPLRWGEPLDAQWQWQELNGELFTLRMAFDNDAMLQLWPTVPPCYFDPCSQTTGGICQSLPSHFAQGLLDIPTVSRQQLPLLASQLRSKAGEQAMHIPKVQLAGVEELQPPITRLIIEAQPNRSKNHKARMRLSFIYQGIEISPHAKNLHATGKINGQAQQVYRDLTYEADVLTQLRDLNVEINPPKEGHSLESFSTLTFGAASNWLGFATHIVPTLRQQGWQVEIADNFPYQILDITGGFTAAIEEEGDANNPFFSLALSLEVADRHYPAFPLLLAAVESLPKNVLQDDLDWPHPIYVELSEEEFVSFNYQDIRPLVRQFIELFAPERLDDQGRLRLSRYQSLHTFDALEAQQVEIQGGQACRQMAQRLRDFDGIQEADVPQTLQATLRPYQRQGLNWLQFLREYQLAGILADDMGLGKTLQTLSHLLTEKHAGRLTQPTLIIAPTSVVFNWRAETTKFAPELSLLIHHGPDRAQDLSAFKDVDLVITSYALLVKDEELLKQQPFYYLVLDESHTIKNPKTKLYSALLSLQVTHRLCLTGTPLQNNLGDIWSHFNFLLPGFLGTQREFNTLFRNPIEKQGAHERQHQLSARLAPFMLRRTKEKIAQDLPPKTEIIQKIHLDGPQAQLYESVRLSMDQRLREVIARKGLQRSQIELLDALLKLRQCCCHPKLLPSDLAQSVTESAKLDTLMEMLPELVSEGRSVLVFSQFTSMLALIETELQAQGLPYLILTGQSRNREAIVNAFQQGEAPIFLISLKAGGVGLNLTRADTVIHFDPWWNPATENQATDRAHRIGQDKPVFVYKLLVEGSIEETIFDLQAHKQALADAVLTEQQRGETIELSQMPLEALLAPLAEIEHE